MPHIHCQRITPEMANAIFDHIAEKRKGYEAEGISLDEVNCGAHQAIKHVFGAMLAALITELQQTGHCNSSEEIMHVVSTEVQNVLDVLSHILHSEAAKKASDKVKVNLKSIH